MISKIQQRIASLLNLWILMILLLTIQSVSSNQIVDLIHTIRNRTSDDDHPKINLVSEFRDILQAIQHHLYNSSSRNCFPGFHFYRGSCYSLSSMSLSWPSAFASCSNKRNSSLAVLKTKDELDFVANTLLKTSGVKQAFIGLRAIGIGKWYWLDGRTLWDEVFGHLYYPYRIDSAHCGLILRHNETHVAIEGRDCVTDKEQYVCKYVQNFCYENNICGHGGSCLSKGMMYMCKCNFLYRGTRCEKFSSKAIQSIIALPLIILMGLLGCCLKFDLCSRCQSKKRRRMNDDLFNERQIILETHDRKQSLMTQY